MAAHTDQTTDPRLQDELLQARRGTAFFARKLNELRDTELDGPSLLPGWTRRRVVAHVGYNARAIARLIEWAATGVETSMYSSPQARNHEIEFGATLPPIALRHLFDHSAVHLNVEWRDLPADAWHHKVKTAQGRVVPAEETVWMRTREVWLHAVDLDNGASFSDIPSAVLVRLLKDITTAWSSRGTDAGLHVSVTDRSLPVPLVFGDSTQDSFIEVSGPLAGVVQWATGRGSSAVKAAIRRTGAKFDAGRVSLDEDLTAVPIAPQWI